jgi:hypothetical protein
MRPRRPGGPYYNRHRTTHAAAPWTPGEQVQLFATAANTTSALEGRGDSTCELEVHVTVGLVRSYQARGRSLQQQPAVSANDSSTTAHQDRA